uniref:Uncharacterized protein n=1 Tax=Arundo donax TaxID=35708 RepID=A0A0A8Z6U7_ARUDO
MTRIHGYFSRVGQLIFNVKKGSILPVALPLSHGL